MKSLFIATLLTVMGCASGPQPQHRLFVVPISGATYPIPPQQAWAICQPESKLAGARGASAASGAAPSYDCRSTAAGSTVSTTCDPRANAGQAIADLGDAIIAGAQREEMQAQALSGCLARYGYRPESRCVANCR